MSADVVVLTTYSLVLSGAAYGLRALGRRSTSPWSSRALAGHLRATGEKPEPLHDDDWPHSEVPRLYARMALVAAVAATALSIAGLVLQDGGVGAGLALAALVVAVLTLRRLARAGH